MKLTPRQQQIVDLRNERPQPSWTEIAKRLGTTKANASTHYSNAMKRLEQPEPKYPKVRSDAVEQKNPELVPEVVDLASDPFETVAAMARKLDMPESTLKDLMKRLRSRYGPLVTAAEDVKTDVLERLFSTNAQRCLEAVSDHDIEKAGLRDKAVAAGIYTDKSLLLSGLPTQRVVIEDRRQFNEVFVEAVRVAKARGLDMPELQPPGDVQDAKLLESGQEPEPQP